MKPTRGRPYAAWGKTAAVRVPKIFKDAVVDYLKKLKMEYKSKGEKS